jgi:PAS domain S-box-containing protein
MKKWTAMKKIIQASGRPNDLFLTLINEDGLITSANSIMIKELHLDHPRIGTTNFFDLVHPSHIHNFRKLFDNKTVNSSSQGIELYVKNGHYHPMKWHVNYIREDNSSKKTYLCLGYNILDHARRKKFNNLVRNNHQLLIENFSGIIFHDANGDIVATNQKTAAIFNSSLEELYSLDNIGQSWNTKWAISDENGLPLQFEEAPFIKALRTGRPQKQTLLIKLANGEDRWITFHSQALPAKETGGDFSVVSSIIDVTNERRLSRQLKEKDSMIYSFLQQTTQLAWVIDDEAILHFASKAFYDHFGIDEKRDSNKRVTDLVPGTVTKALFEQHQKVFNTGKALETTQRVQWADGSTLISHINLFPLGTIDGKKLVGGQAVHLPDRRDLERELHEANQRLVNLNRTTSDAIWEWDMKSGRVFQNEILLGMIGYQPDRLRGISWWLRNIHSEDRHRIADKIKDATERHLQAWDDEYQFKCADGNYKHIRHKGYVVYEDGLPVKMIGSLNDVSGFKALENRLADEKIKRQKEISEAVIRAEEKERTQIGRELHDNVNQLLSATKLFVDVLKPHGKEQQLIKTKSIQYIQLAIDEIRKVSKELVAPQLKDEGLVESIRELVEDLELVSPVKIQFIHELESERLSPGIKITLFRIVQEQLKNILKHSKAENTSILLHSGNGQLELTIEDDGAGFDPKQTYPGIGLNNIRERVKFYNGDVEIRAGLGTGCKLLVRIPIGEE